MLTDTPIEKYTIKGIPIFVQREDLCGPKEAPPFSKIRGIIPALLELKKQGYTTIGYTETSVSMAGWGLAWACSLLGLKCIIFDPQYKETPALLKYHRKQWNKFDAQLIPLPAGRAKVNFYKSAKILKEFPNSYLVPLGMPFPETLEETKIQAEKSIKKIKPQSIVVNVGSGTICAGVLSAAENAVVYGIMGRSGNAELKKKQIMAKAGVWDIGLLANRKLILHDPGWEYTEPSSAKCPFPCHPFYDLKAVEWMIDNINELKQPILFWNIGRIK